MISRTVVLYQKSLGRIFHHVMDLRRRRPFSSVGEILLLQEKLLKTHLCCHFVDHLMNKGVRTRRSVARTAASASHGTAKGGRLDRCENEATWRIRRENRA